MRTLIQLSLLLLCVTCLGCLSPQTVPACTASIDGGGADALNPSTRFGDGAVNLDKPTDAQTRPLQRPHQDAAALDVGVDTPDTSEVAPAQPEPTPTGDLTCSGKGVWPGASWSFKAPDELGFDPTKLQDTLDQNAKHQTQCVVVVRGGHIVAEWYAPGVAPTQAQKSWSVAKSYASTLVGIAVDRGDLPNLDAKAADWIPSWKGDGRASISLRHLLSMSSGLAFDLTADNVGMVLAKDMTAKAIKSPLVKAPGSAWEYSNHTVQSMEAVLREATGMNPETYAQVHLFGPLGMKADWAEDKNAQPALYMNVKASCRDHARFGYLMLKQGCWGTKRVISESWISEATKPSTAHNKGYGLWWWLNGGMPTLDSVDFHDKGQSLHPFAPSDAFCAVGLGSQFIEVVPSLDLVVVRMGIAPPDDIKLLLKPKKLAQALKADGAQIPHNALLEGVLNALVKP